MNVLVLNCGSSSLKYQLINMNTGGVLCSGLVERIGEPKGTLIHKVAPGAEGERKYTLEQPFPNHKAGMNAVMALLVDPEKGVIKDLKEIGAVLGVSESRVSQLHSQALARLRARVAG